MLEISQRSGGGGAVLILALAGYRLHSRNKMQNALAAAM